MLNITIFAGTNLISKMDFFFLSSWFTSPNSGKEKSKVDLIIWTPSDFNNKITQIDA